MDYRSDISEPPKCPAPGCGQPAVLFDPLFGVLRCPEYHSWTKPKGYEARGLPGLSGLRACSCGSTSWRLMLHTPSWWRRLFGSRPKVMLACTNCLAGFEAGCTTCGARHDQDCDAGLHS